MATIYIAISAFENMVCKFVLKVLLEHKGENWWDECLMRQPHSALLSMFCNGICPVSVPPCKILYTFLLRVSRKIHPLFRSSNTSSL